jgi:FkbM family methyltransferase
MSAWDWKAFRGGATELKYNRRDLPNLDRAIALTQQRRVAVQAGGHLGIWPKRLAASFHAVYTFEPDPVLFMDLCHNAPERNIIKCQAAVGNARRLVGLSSARRDGRDGPLHKGLTHIAGDGLIPTLMIDDLGLTTCDLLALDLEGWELYALLGAVNTITTCRPVLAIEVNQNSQHFGIQEEFLRDTIKALGYRFVQRLQSDELFVPAEWPVENVA